MTMKRTALIYPVVLAALVALSLGIAPVAAAKEVVAVVPESHVPFFEYIAEEFEQETGATLTIVSQAYDLTHEVIVAAAAGGNTGFDVAVVDTVYVPTYAVAGVIA